MERHQVHPRHVRIAHGINPLVLLVLLWSGFAMLVGDRHFASYVHMVPAAVWSALQLTGHRIQGRAWHMGMAIAFIANAAFYGATSLASGSWRRILPRRSWLRDAWKATVEELTAPRAALGRAEYNGAQRLAYTLVMAGGVLMILTGLALWFGRRFPWMLTALGGQRVALTVHVVIAIGLVAFILIHVVQVLRAGLPTIVAMMTGSPAGRPAPQRRALAWSAAVLASVIAAFALVNHSSGPSGVPAFLRWAVPQRGEGGSVDVIARHPHRHTKRDG